MKLSDDGDKNGSVVDYSDPFAISSFIDKLDSGKYGSVTSDIEALVSWSLQVLGPYLKKHPGLSTILFDGKKDPNKDASMSQENVIDLEDDSVTNNPQTKPRPVVILDSDDEDDIDHRSTYPFQEVVLARSTGQFIADTAVSFYYM